ncbi:MAG: hypothetical protein ABIY55_05360 [Kofleriaceae bacterium]
MYESQSKKSSVDWQRLEADMERPHRYERIPGSFRYWEIAQVVHRDADYRVREDGATSDNTRLFAVYRLSVESFDEAPTAQLPLPITGLGPEAVQASSTVDVPGRASTPRPSSVDNWPIDYTLMPRDPAAGPAFVRVPGLFGGWDLQRRLALGIEPGTEWHIEPAGTRMADGRDLFALFTRTQHEGKP